MPSTTKAKVFALPQRLLRNLRSVTWLNRLAFALAAVVMPFAFQIMPEYIRMRNVAHCAEYVMIRFKSMVPGYIFLVMLYLAIEVLSMRAWVANLSVGILLFGMGCGNYYKLAFRGDPLVPYDFVQLKEAAMISTELNLTITRAIWRCLFFVIITTVLLSLFRISFAKTKAVTFGRIGGFVALVVAMGLFLFGYIGNSQRMQERHNMQTVAASTADSYYRSTFVSYFLYLLADIYIEPPENYTEQTMQQIADEIALPQNVSQPDIVVVLLESFYDVQTIKGTSYSQDLMSNFTRLAKEGISGQLLSNKRDGGTSDFEFQVLTGYSTMFFDAGAVPMMQYTTQNIACLPQYLAKQGYSSVAIHTYIRSFYNRPNAYEAMKIQEFISVESFADHLVLGNYISDDALANRIIAEYEQRAVETNPIFMHTITMQNHMPYTGGTYPDNYGVVATSGVSAEYDDILSTYATGVRDEDALIGKLCDYFDSIDREVVVVFFGDHQSSVGSDMLPDLAQQTAQYQNATALEQQDMTHTTPYLIWSNFQKEQIDGGKIAPYLLIAQLANHYTIDLPPYFYWLTCQLEQGGGVSGGYYILPDGSISLEATAEQTQQTEKHRLLQHDLLFGKQYAYQTFGEATK